MPFSIHRFGFYEAGAQCSCFFFPDCLFTAATADAGDAEDVVIKDMCFMFFDDQRGFIENVEDTGRK